MMTQADHSLTVLIADDSQITRRRLGQLLCEAPEVFVVTCTASRTDIIDAVNHTVPDCALVDVCSPSFNDFRVLSLIRALAPTCLLIALFDQPSAELERLSREAGADQFMSKHGDIERLCTIVQSLSLESVA